MCNNNNLVYLVYAFILNNNDYYLNGGVHLEWMMEQGYLVSLPERHA